PRGQPAPRPGGVPQALGTPPSLRIHIRGDATVTTRELLAIPAWDKAPIPIDDWRSAFTSRGQPARSVREDDETWIDVAPLRLRGYVVLEGEGVGAVHFEVRDDAALGPLEEAAASLGWELHDDEGEGDDDESEVEDSDGPL